MHDVKCGALHTKYNGENIIRPEEAMGGFVAGNGWQGLFSSHLLPGWLGHVVPLVREPTNENNTRCWTHKQSEECLRMLRNSWQFLFRLQHRRESDESGAEWLGLPHEYKFRN